MPWFVARYLHRLSAQIINFLVFAGLLISCAVCQAQIPSASDVTSTPIPNAGHDYIHALSETVNPANGSLSIRINVPLPPSRGPNIPFNFAYDSNGVFYLSQLGGNGLVQSGFGWNTTRAPLSQGGWSYSVPMLSVQDSPTQVQVVNGTDQVSVFTCDTWINYVFQDANGNRQNLGLTTFNPNPNCVSEAGLEGPDTTAQVGPFLAQMDPNWYNVGTVSPVDVIDADGTDYSFDQQAAPLPGPCPLGQASCPGTEAVSFITDRNGNTASFSATTGGGITYTDTIGRVALSMPTFGASQDAITVSGLSQPYTVNWTTVAAQFPITMNNIYSSGVKSCPTDPGPEPTIPVISSIVLPNGQQYTFSYDSRSGPTYGLITKITYPTGGYVRYEWGLNSQATFDRFAFYSQIPTDNGDGTPNFGVTILEQTGSCGYYSDTPAIAHRYVSYDGQNEVEQQDFTYSTSWNPPSTWGNGAALGTWTQKQTTVVTKDISVASGGPQYSTAYTYVPNYTDYQPNGGLPVQVPVENNIQYYGTDGSLLQTVGKTWGNTRILTQQQTTLNNGFLSETDWAYNTNEMMTEKDEYDYGSGSRGPLLRKTLFPSYHSFNTHIVDKPDSAKVLDASGNPAAGASYVYDPSGNMLSRSNWLNSTGTSSVTTSHMYDGYGNIISTTDPKGYVTGYSYTDPFVDNCSYTTPANAYLTRIIYPTTNGVPHTESFHYYCASGNLASSTDENGQATTYTYNDPLNRLKQITYPVTTDGTTGSPGAGYTSYTYVDTPGSVSVTKQYLQNTSGTLVANVTSFDGVGRVLHSQLTLNPSSTVTVDKTYDSFGRVQSVSNPYRTPPSSNDPPYGLTSYTYDALGRTLLQCQPDNVNNSPCQPGNSYLKWGYSGNVTSFRNEVGNMWQRTSDAFGRLTDVTEPGNLKTHYTYNAVGDLLCADQWETGTVGTPCASSHKRSFSYDLLSRLGTSTNPETGTITYQYTAAGALCAGDVSLPCSKTDARGTTAVYNYDALNRVTSKQYSSAGGSDTTPASCYTYDTAVSGIGKLAVEWTQVGSCSPTAPATDKSTQRFILSYDTVGRILTEKRCILGNCKTSAVPFSITSGYDLAGNLTGYDNGVGTLTITNSYDAAGRLFQIGSSVSDITHPSSLYNVSDFFPTGASHIWTLGSNISITQNYDSRLRPKDLTAVKQ